MLNRMVSVIKNVVCVWVIGVVYKQLFDYEEEFRLYKKALQEIYKVQAMHYGSQKRNEMFNYTLCLEDDFQKLIHGDTVLKDLYAQRDTAMRDDAAKIVLEERFFETNPENVRWGEEEHQLRSPFVMFDIQKHHEKKSRYCLFSKQMNFQGITQLRDKPKLASHHYQYFRKMKRLNKTKQCMAEVSYQKQSYKLYDKEQCLHFFQIIDSEDYKARVEADGFQYVIKGNAHAGESIYVMTKKVTERLRKLYRNGKECGISKDQYIAQEYIVHPLLFKKNKIDLRIYIAMPSNDPMQLFILNETTIRRCSRKYSPKLFETYSHVCHPSSLEEYQKPYYVFKMTFLQLAQHLVSEGLVNSTDWLSDYFLPHLYRKIGHMFLSTSHLLTKDNSQWQIYAVDVMMDRNLNIWIIECNTNPILYSYYYNSTDVHFKFAESAIDLISQVVRRKYQNIREVLFNDVLPQVRKNKSVSYKLQEKIVKSLQDPILHTNETKNLIKISLEKVRKICK